MGIREPRRQRRIKRSEADDGCRRERRRGGWLATLEEYATLLGDYKERKLDGSSSATEDVEMAIVVSKEWLQMLKSLDKSPMKDAIQRRGKPERFVLQFADIMKRHGLME